LPSSDERSGAPSIATALAFAKVMRPRCATMIPSGDDQPAVAFLALAQCLLGLPALGDVAGATAVAAEPARAVEDRLAARRGETTDAGAILVGVDEIPKWALRRQVGEMSIPVVVAGIAQSDLVAAPAQACGQAFADLAPILIREPGEAEMLVHLPEPVGSGLGEIAKTALARARLLGVRALGDRAAQLRAGRTQADAFDHEPRQIDQQAPLLG
jgi:hypothetical protein